MRTQSEALKLFKENVVGATVNAPDNYPAWDTGGYASHRADLLSLWAEIKPRVQQDTERVALIDALLHDAIALFDRSERDTGQRLMFQIYNTLEQGPMR